MQDLQNLETIVTEDEIIRVKMSATTFAMLAKVCRENDEDVVFENMHFQDYANLINRIYDIRQEQQRQRKEAAKQRKNRKIQKKKDKENKDRNGSTEIADNTLSSKDLEQTRKKNSAQNDSNDPIMGLEEMETLMDIHTRGHKEPNCENDIIMENVMDIEIDKRLSSEVLGQTLQENNAPNSESEPVMEENIINTVLMDIINVIENSFSSED